jgi:hypothetical protein
MGQAWVDRLKVYTFLMLGLWPPLVYNVYNVFNYRTLCWMFSQGIQDSQSFLSVQLETLASDVADILGTSIGIP